MSFFGIAIEGGDRLKTMGQAASHRQVFREEVRNAIRESIFSGKLVPGDRIIETYWANEIGVSQGPVREAIRDLEAMGLIETIPFKGSRVRLLTKKDIQDNYGVRMCLEEKSIRDAITLLPDDKFYALCSELKTILDTMKQCADNADLRNWTESDAAFHRAIIESLENNVLLKLWEQCNIRNWFMISILTDSESLRQLYESHLAIYNALSIRDVQRANFLLENQLVSMMNGFIDEIEDDNN